MEAVSTAELHGSGACDLFELFNSPYRNLLEEVTPLAGCGAGTLPWGQRTTCSNKAGGV